MIGKTLAKWQVHCERESQHWASNASRPTALGLINHLGSLEPFAQQAARTFRVAAWELSLVVWCPFFRIPNRATLPSPGIPENRRSKWCVQVVPREVSRPTCRMMLASSQWLTPYAIFEVHSACHL